jgi:hypothetical protein
MEREVADIHKRVLKNIEELVGDFSNALTIELNKERQQDSYVYLVAENRLKRKIKKTTLEKYNRAIAEIEATSRKISKIGPDMDYDDRVANDIVKSIGESIAVQFQRMTNSMLTIMRVDQIAIRRTSRKERVSIRKSIEMARMDGFLSPQYHFRDKSGRRWTTDAYFRMLINTFVYSTAREIAIEKAIHAGHKEIEIINGEIIKVEDYEELKSALFHPNSKKLLKMVEV